MSGSVTASYVYDGDGNRVKETIGGVTRVFVGNTYEVDNGTVKKYYYAGATRVAESSGGVLYYLLTDHLGSTALTLDSSGVRVTELRYYPYGGVRYNPGGQVTTSRFTGQRWDSGTAVYFYQSRWYDPLIGRFLAADTIVPQPQDPQSLNRYSYVGNQPLRFTDPTGHCIDGISTIACVAVAGFIAGGVVDLGKQLIVDRKDIRDVNWAEVGGAAVGGLVAGATLGLAPAGASLLGVAALGGVGSAAGGQVQALTQAGIEQLMGKNPQKSVMEQARQLGLFDTGAIAADMTAGVVMGGLGGKFAGWLRAKLPLPGSASAITLRSDMPMARWQLRLDQPGIWTVKMEGRVLNIDADVFEKIVRSIAIGGYDAAEQILQEAIQQGLVDVVEETAQP